MGRVEFSKPVKREALRRSGGRCEAVGALYGLELGMRCSSPLGYGVEFDHVVLQANSKDNSLGNCAAVCKQCHKIKTARHDIPMAAKTLRLQDAHHGIRQSGNPMPGSKQSKWKRKMDGTVELRNGR